jgi:hypothetical protein
MSELIGIDIEGVPQVVKMLERIASPEVRRKVTRAVADYFRGQMRKYPSYTYVSRKRAYGRTFQSVKQRRWFFAALRDGRLVIPYARTFRLRNNWKVLPFGESDYVVANDVRYAKFVQNSPQARMMTLRNWRSIQRVGYEEGARIERVAVEAYNAAIKRL